MKATGVGGRSDSFNKDVSFALGSRELGTSVLAPIGDRGRDRQSIQVLGTDQEVGPWCRPHASDRLLLGGDVASPQVNVRLEHSLRPPVDRRHKRKG